MSESEDLVRSRDLLDLREGYPNNEYGLLLFSQRCISSLIPGDNTLVAEQADILRWLFGGPLYRGVEANRGIGKTCLAGIYCTFRLIHQPHYRVVVFSQNSKRSKEISGWIIKIIMGLPELACLRPDRNRGDKSSLTEGFDIYGGLKGQDKSPSITSYSIEGGAQGARADIILADDIESLQNSRTVQGREWLEEVSKEFESINQRGDIIYLGTPQSVNSIYNNLPQRGYAIRTWTARYPTEEEIPAYKGKLSPWITNAIEKDPSLQTGGGIFGDEGKPTCPEMFDEESLQTKEVSQGKAKFKLQYMISTALTDAERYPLKLKDLVVTDFNAAQAPVLPIWSNSSGNLYQNLPNYGTRSEDRFYSPVQPADGFEVRPFTRVIMYIDPAGKGRGGDATSFSILGLLEGYLYLLDIGSVNGGWDEDDLMQIVLAGKNANVNEVFMEKNFGYGSHWHVLKPLFDTHHPCVFPEENLKWESQQKEIRIIDTLEPVISSHRLVVSSDVVRKDSKIIQRYPSGERMQFSLFSQMSLITRDKGSLPHEDALDSLAGAVRELSKDIAFNAESFVQARRAKDEIALVKGWQDPKSRRKWLSGHSGHVMSDKAGLADIGTSNQFRRRGRAGRRKF